MATIIFTKMHGLGNDYHFIDAARFPISDPAALSRVMSHRHLGVGSDGVILVLPGAQGADFTMRIFNADGSEAETCGNGIRCFAKYVYERGMTTATEFVIQTGAGPNKVKLAVEGGKVVSVRSNMGKPRFDATDIPFTGTQGHVIDFPLDVNGVIYPVTCANIGNPHAVLFMDDPANAPLTTLGPLIENHPFFPKRTNVEFVKVVDEANIIMRIWERGSGVTMASGSGSCGSALACMISGKTGRRVTVHLVFGALTIEWAADGHVYQEGPATDVFTGEWVI